MKLPDHDTRNREESTAYHVETYNGLIVCVRKGLTLIDFYSSTTILAKDHKPKETSEIPKEASSH